MGKGKKNSAFWSISKLRMTLFRIWFVKNILVFIQILLITCFVLMITGNIDRETPLIGPILYPLFSDLIDEIKIIVESRNMQGWMDFVGKGLSILVSITVFTIKARSIAQSDIKNKKLKKALVDAGLYFNENGKLVKKEKSIHQDNNGDGVIDENDGKVSTNVFTGLFDAIKEFIVIANADFSGDEEEDKELFDETLTKANLEETSAGLDNLENQMKDKIGINVSDDDTSKKKQKFSLWRKRHFSEVSDEDTIDTTEETIVESEADEEIIITNNVSEHSEIPEKEITIENIVNEIIEENTTPSEPIIEKEPEVEKVVESVKPTVKNKHMNTREKKINAYLSRMQGGR